MQTSEVPSTELLPDSKTKRHEFAEKGSEDSFVVFEGEESRPFWRRKGDSIRFVHTNLTLEKVKRMTFLVHTEQETTGEEFHRYYKEALEKHEQPAG